jgi:hypothetical protein
VAKHLGEEAVAEVAELGGGVELERAGGEDVAQAAELGVGEEIDAGEGEREAGGDLEAEGVGGVTQDDLAVAGGW